MPIRDPEFTGANPADQLSERLASMFLSLLMALAFRLQTRIDLAIYIVALQRYAQNPNAEHIKKLNTIVFWAIKNSLKKRAYVYEVLATA